MKPMRNAECGLRSVKNVQLRVFFKRLKSYQFTGIFIFPIIFFLGSVAFAETVTRARYLMGTACEIEAHGNSREELEQAVTAAFEEIARLEGILNHFRPESELSRLNRVKVGVPFLCSMDLFEVLKWSDRAAQETEGCFNISRGTAEWRLNEQERTITFKRKMGQRDSEGKSINLPGLTPRDGLDFGGIGKGYALDEAAKKLIQAGVTGARLNFGGQVLVVGRPPASRGWKVKIVTPDGKRIFQETWLMKGSLSTSSNYERPHIVDPQTRAPVYGRGSVTVAASTGAWADALSTGLLVMGEERGKKWASGHSDVQVIFQKSRKEEEKKK